MPTSTTPRLPALHQVQALPVRPARLAQDQDREETLARLARKTPMVMVQTKITKAVHRGLEDPPDLANHP